MLKHKSTSLALLFAALALGACSDDNDPFTPPPPTAIEITPDPVPILPLNSPLGLAAVLTNAPAGAVVLWASSNPTGVRVSVTGVVTCLQLSADATITATISDTDPLVQDAVSVSCSATAPIVEGAQISITQFQDPLGGDIDPNELHGVIAVLAEVEVPEGLAASAVRVLVGSTEVCRTMWTRGAASATVACSFNTAQLAGDGSPLFPNGAHEINAEVLGAADAVLAAANTRRVIFSN
jgi:hypothetical protein